MDRCEETADNPQPGEQMWASGESYSRAQATAAVNASCAYCYEGPAMGDNHCYATQFLLPSAVFVVHAPVDVQRGACLLRLGEGGVDVPRRAHDASEAGAVA